MANTYTKLYVHIVSFYRKFSLTIWMAGHGDPALQCKRLGVGVGNPSYKRDVDGVAQRPRQIPYAHLALIWHYSV